MRKNPKSPFYLLGNEVINESMVSKKSLLLAETRRTEDSSILVGPKV